MNSDFESFSTLFEKQVMLTPNELAISDGETELTYQELYEKTSNCAQIIATLLQGKSHNLPENEPLVVLFLKNKVSLVIGLLSILRAQAAYLILDTEYPLERVDYCIKDSRPSLILTDEVSKIRLPLGHASLLIEELTALHQDLEFPKKSLCQNIGMDKLAYVVYTSGTTGSPKGILVEHKSLSNVILHFKKVLSIGQGDIWFSVTSPGFDIFALEVFLPLISGARCQLYSRDSLLDIEDLKGALIRYNPDFMQATPSLWGLMDKIALPIIKKMKVLVGGERLPVALGQCLLSAFSSVMNVYGPAETTIWSTAYSLLGNEKGSIPIGKSISNTHYLILNEELGPVKQGEIGSLYLGGLGLARAYLAKPELNAKKFILRGQERYYQTGDLVRLLPSGDLEFIGRNDTQVKINGHRIELSEIEALCEQNISGIQVTALLDKKACEKILLFYVNSPSAPIDEQFLKHLMKQLPLVMRPSFFVPMTHFPMNTHGKIDREALYQSYYNAEAPSLKNKSANLLNKITSIWEEVLGKSPIDSQSEFVFLGGTSIHMTQIVARMNQTLNLRLTIRHFMQNQSIFKLHQKINELASEKVGS